MSIWKFFLDLIEAEQQQSREIAEVKHSQHRLERILLRVEDKVEAQGRDIFQILLAVVPKPVTKIRLSNKTGEAMSNIQAGQKSHLTAQFLDADGAPTIPIDTPAWQATDVTNFDLAVASDTQSADLTATGAAGNTDEVSVSVDGITSNVLTYTLVETPPPPPKPVASIVLTGTDPA